jgi:hypothetical protein
MREDRTIAEERGVAAARQQAIMVDIGASHLPVAEIARAHRRTQALYFLPLCLTLSTSSVGR